MPDTAWPVSAARLVVQAKRLEIEALRRLAARAELVDVIGQLIHALQRERGTSAVFLASQGRRFADARRAVIDEVDQIEARLRALVAERLELAHGASARILSLAAWMLLGLDALAGLRERIDRQDPSPHDAVALYSALIAGAMELIVEVADAAPVPAISRRLVAFLHLAQGKEAAGQERALGALSFASGRCSEAHRDRLAHLIDAQDRSLEVFAQFASDEQRARWEALRATPAATRLESLRQVLCATRPGAPLDPACNDGWFDVCSVRIDGLWHLEVDLMRAVRDDCAAEIRRAEQDLQDSEGLLQRLRDHPPAHIHAVERFFDTATRPTSAPDLVRPGGTASLLDLLRARTAELGAKEAELDAVRRALRERKVVERAKGLLMDRLGLSEEAAFKALRKAAMDQHRTLLEVAEMAIERSKSSAMPARAARD